MPIYRDKARGRFVFEFDRRIEGRRVRAQKLLPRTWNQAQADAFDRKESARLYALATRVGGAEYTIDEAVAVYLDERIPHLKHGLSQAKELNLMTPYFDGRPMSALPDVCKAYRLKATKEQSKADEEAGKPKEPLAPATIKNRLRYLVAACRYAWKNHNMSEHDPAERVVMPEVDNERQEYVTRAEMIRIARKCSHRAVRAMIRIAFYSGMRAGEIMRAKIVGTAFVLSTTKNGDPRIVPIHPKIRCCLHYKWPIKETRNYHWHRALRLLEMRPLHFHDLRHSAASAMIGEGVSLHTVGAVLGHRSAQSTKRYAHLAVGHLQAAVFGIGRKVA